MLVPVPALMFDWRWVGVIDDSAYDNDRTVILPFQ